MMRTRAYDARMLLAQRQGKTRSTCSAPARRPHARAPQALRHGDMNFPTYRQQACSSPAVTRSRT